MTQRWEVEHPFREPGVYVSDQNTALIAKLHGPDAEANARLIAAAPDLLAALEDAEFLMRKIALHPNDAWAMRDSFTRSAQDARAAIAKAK